MDILNPTALKSLIAQEGKWCVSLYMPTHRIGREQQQNAEHQKGAGRKGVMRQHYPLTGGIGNACSGHGYVSL